MNCRNVHAFVSVYCAHEASNLWGDWSRDTGLDATGEGARVPCLQTSRIRHKESYMELNCLKSRYQVREKRAGHEKSAERPSKKRLQGIVKLTPVEREQVFQRRQHYPHGMSWGHAMVTVRVTIAWVYLFLLVNGWNLRIHSSIKLQRKSPNSPEMWRFGADAVSRGVCCPRRQTQRQWLRFYALKVQPLPQRTNGTGGARILNLKASPVVTYQTGRATWCFARGEPWNQQSSQLLQLLQKNHR